MVIALMVVSVVLLTSIFHRKLASFGSSASTASTVASADSNTDNFKLIFRQPKVEKIVV
jgi:hypothetical protein